MQVRRRGGIEKLADVTRHHVEIEANRLQSGDQRSATRVAAQRVERLRECLSSMLLVDLGPQQAKQLGPSDTTRAGHRQHGENREASRLLAGTGDWAAEPVKAQTTKRPSSEAGGGRSWVAFAGETQVRPDMHDTPASRWRRRDHATQRIVHTLISGSNA